MVTVNLPLNDDVQARVKKLADEQGRSFEEVIADLVTTAVDEDDLELTPEQHRDIEESLAELDRGESVTAQEVFAKLKALR